MASRIVGGTIAKELAFRIAFPEELLFDENCNLRVILITISAERFGSKVGGLIGSIFGSLPAKFLYTLVITKQAGCPDFSRSVGKSLLIIGLVNVPLYEIVVRFLYPSIGLMPGTAIALLFTLLMAI